MTHLQYTDAVHNVAAGLLLVATLYSFAQFTQPEKTRDSKPVFDEIGNQAIVVANMTNDLRYFRMCPQQAAMLAEQTADFGVLGLMTTAAAVGIDTKPATSRPPIERTAFDSTARHGPLLAGPEE